MKNLRSTAEHMTQIYRVTIDTEALDGVDPVHTDSLVLTRPGGAVVDVHFTPRARETYNRQRDGFI